MKIKNLTLLIYFFLLSTSSYASEVRLNCSGFIRFYKDGPKGTTFIDADFDHEIIIDKEEYHF